MRKHYLMLCLRELAVVSEGTDTHLVLVDLRPKKLTGKAAERSLENAGITCNKNGVPFDPESPFVTSGIRLGSPAGTSRGFGINEFRLIGDLIGDVLDGLSENPDDNSKVENEVKVKVKQLCEKYQFIVRLFDKVIICAVHSVVMKTQLLKTQGPLKTTALLEEEDNARLVEQDARPLKESNCAS